MMTYVYSGVAGLFLAATLLIMQPGAPAAEPPAATEERAPAEQAVASGEQWTIDLLAALGNTQPTQESIAFLEAWHRAEGGTAAYNWLNTTQDAPGATDYNSVHVRNYPDYQTGIQATAETLTNGRYPNTLAGLQSNAPVVDDGELGTWGTGGGGVRAQLAEAPQAAPAPASDPIRQQLVEMALSQMGKGYILGAAGPDHFDCSGLMQWTYRQYGMEISRTTFTQLEAPQLRPISEAEIQTGDMIYFQFPSDQHVGMLADLDGDGRWDMVQSGGTRSDVNTVSDVLNDPVYNNNIIGYRSAF